jgi:hypothetical protein
MNQSGAHRSKVNIAGFTTAETALRVCVVSWRDHLAQDRGRGRSPGSHTMARPCELGQHTIRYEATSKPGCYEAAT